MERTECPINWNDKSEFFDGEWDYEFRLTVNDKFALIKKWADESLWTLRIGNDDGSFLSRAVETAGEFENVADAIALANSWIESDKNVFEFVGK